MSVMTPIIATMEFMVGLLQLPISLCIHTLFPSRVIPGESSLFSISALSFASPRFSLFPFGFVTPPNWLSVNAFLFYRQHSVSSLLGHFALPIYLTAAARATGGRGRRTVPTWIMRRRSASRPVSFTELTVPNSEPSPTTCLPLFSASCNSSSDENGSGRQLDSVTDLIVAHRDK